MMLAPPSGAALMKASIVPHKAASSSRSRIILGQTSGPRRPSRVEIANESATVQSQMPAANTTANGAARRARSRIAITLLSGRRWSIHPLRRCRQFLLPDVPDRLDLLVDVGHRL